VFISYRHVHPDQGLALGLARALQSEHDVFIDAGLAGGQKWAEVIDHELTSADFLIALVSEAAAESPMVLAEIEPAHLSEQARGRPVIIPVRVAYDDAYSYRLRAYLSRFQALAWQGESDTPELLRRIQATLAGSPAPIQAVGGARPWWKRLSAVLARSEALTERERCEMLKRVRSFRVDGLLEHSLENVVRLELGLAQRPDAVTTALSMSAGRAAQLVPDLPSGDGRLAIFDHYQGALLILGAPGAGKSTWLLELARDLLDRAAHDPDHPIPVIFNLSSWAVRRGPLSEWMAEELNRLYDAPRRQSRKWVGADKVLPLLDGLDEVAPEFRHECVGRINEFRKQHWLLPVVVCSRDAEYESLGERLGLFGAVMIRSLTREQIEAAVEAAGDSLLGLKAALAADPGLWEVLDTPLMLSVTLLACRDRPEEAAGLASGGGPAAQPAGDGTPAADRRERVFRAYVRRMFEERGEPTPPASEQETLNFLGFLARMSERHGQTEFFASDLQPTWLPSRAERWRYAFVSRQFIGLAILISFFAVLELAPGAAEHSTSHPLWAWFDSAWGDLITVILLCVPGAVLRAVFIHRRFGDAQAGAGPCIRRRLSALAWLVSGASAGALLGWIQVTLERPPADERVETLLLFAISLGLLCIGGRNAARDVKRPEVLTWSWAHAARGMGWALAGPVFLLVGMADSLGSFRDYFDVAWRQVLLMTGIFSLGSGLVGAVWNGMRRGLGETKTRPIQGMALTARNAALTAMAAGVVTMVVTMGSIAVANAVHTGRIRLSGSYAGPGISLIETLQDSLLLGTVLALAALFWNGSLDLIKHYTLRRLLHRERHLPWRLGEFLDYSVRLLFLRRIGGGYLFVHRFLREHFAARSG
jgi:hypothetical protein